MLLVGIGLMLAACGTSDPTTSSTPDPVTSEAPADTAAPATDASAPATAAPAADEPTPTEATAGDAPATDPPAADPPVTETPVTEAPIPEPAPLGGRALATEVESAAQFDGNPFPDLVVDDIGRGAQANVANILPSERPVLLWTWAPH